VWEKGDKQNYIDSVGINIIPSPLIFNIDNKKGLYTCMDGLQRMTAIYEFMINRYYIVNNGKKIYYSKIPRKRCNNVKYRILSTREKNIFDNTTISIMLYDDLSVEEQYEIFMRINGGKKLSDNDIEQIINTMNQRNRNKLTSIDERIGMLHVSSDVISLLMYIIHNTFSITDKHPLKIPRTIKDKDIFAKSIDIQTEINIKTEILEIFDRKIFTESTAKNIILGVVYFIVKYKKYNMIEHKYLQTIINTVKIDITGSKKVSYNSLLEIYNHCKSTFNKLIDIDNQYLSDDDIDSD
jgi:hypothetical protein